VTGTISGERHVRLIVGGGVIELEGDAHFADDLSPVYGGIMTTLHLEVRGGLADGRSLDFTFYPNDF
jgi:hypothetical protein